MSCRFSQSARSIESRCVVINKLGWVEDWKRALIWFKWLTSSRTYICAIKCEPHKGFEILRFLVKLGRKSSETNMKKYSHVCTSSAANIFAYKMLINYVHRYMNFLMKLGCYLGDCVLSLKTLTTRNTRIDMSKMHLQPKCCDCLAPKTENEMSRHMITVIW